MQIILTDSFNKSYNKRVKPNRKLKDKFEERSKLFAEGKKIGLRAFSVTGDIRVVYELMEDGRILFVDVGSHNQVYG